MTEAEMRAVQNYATNHVLVQPTPIALSVAQMAVVQKLYPFDPWPEGTVGTASGHPDRASPLYYMTQQH